MSDFSKLDNLIDKIELLVEVINKGGRSNRPVSMYGSLTTNNSLFLEEREDLKTDEFNRIMNKFIEGIKKEIEANKDFIDELTEEKKELKKLLKKGKNEKGETLTDEEKEKIEKRSKKIDEELEKTRRDVRNKQRQKRELEKDEEKREKRYDKEHEKVIHELQKEYKNDSKLQQEYGSFENYKGYLKEEKRQNYANSTNTRREASDMIAHSGLGNTKLGRAAQNVIDIRQRYADMGNFGNKLQNGGAETIAKAIGGGDGTVSALKKFGGALKGVSKVLGPAAIVVEAGVGAIKLFMQGLTALNSYIITMIKTNTNVIQMDFQRRIQEENLYYQDFNEQLKTRSDLVMKTIDLQSQNLMQSIDIFTKQFIKATEIAVGPLTEGINETAYKAANAYIDYQKDIANLNLDIQKRKKEEDNFYERRQGEYRNFLDSWNQTMSYTEKKYKYDVAISTIQSTLENEKNILGSVLNGIIGQSDSEKSATEQGAKIAGGETETMGGVLGENITNFRNAVGDTYINRWADGLFNANTLDKANAMFQNYMLKYSGILQSEWNKNQQEQLTNWKNNALSIQEQIKNKQIEIATEVAKKYNEATAEAKKTWLQLAQKTEQWLDKFDEFTNNLGISLGYTNRKQLDDFQNSMFEAGKIASKFGKSYEDAVKAQQTFVETTGRNRMFDLHDYGQMFGLGKYLGDDGLAASYVSEMEIFNAGVADSVDMLDEALQDVNRMGLNGRKYTKTLVDNLKLAQKYNFKGGTENLMKMAKWAENTRFNMNSLSGMLDKISEGGLEGLITQGAQFQVLGGHAAMNADPIAMMYERYADPEAFAKRMQDMTKGYGAIDRTTGETTFSGSEIMMMEQIAKVQGRSVEDVMNEVRARNKQEVVARQLNGNFNEEQQAFISNNATYNKKTGQFEVRVKNADGTYGTKSVSQLTQEDIDKLMPERHNERMEDYMVTVIDYLAKMTGEENLQKTELGQALNETRKESYEKRLIKAHENFVDYFEDYVTNAKEGMELANEKFSDYIDMWQLNEDAQGPGLDKINAATSNISTALGETAKVINNANDLIKANIDYIKLHINDTKDAVGTFDDGQEAKVQQTMENSQNAAKQVNYSFKYSTIPLIGPLLFALNNRDVLLNQSDYSSGGGGVRDAIISNNKQPIISSASNVIPINDGLVKPNMPIVKSDPKDVAVFAKEGGTLGKSVHEVVDTNRFLAEVLAENNSGINGNNFNLNINGKLELVSQGGNSVDIVETMRTDPIVRREIARMLFKDGTNFKNGGRGMSVNEKLYNS